MCACLFVSLCVHRLVCLCLFECVFVQIHGYMCLCMVCDTVCVCILSVYVFMCTFVFV